MIMKKEYYFSKLNNQEQQYYTKLLQAIKCGEYTVKAPLFLDTESLTNVAMAVDFDHPELFYVDFRHLNFSSSHKGTLFQINYTINKAMRSSVVAEVERHIVAILDESKKHNLKSNYEKCRWIHNYLVRNTTYNYDALTQPDCHSNAFSIIGVLLDKNAVCEGISKVFKLLSNRLGIESIIAYGTSSFEGVGSDVAHSWNIVSIDGEFTHIDITWDIGVSAPCKHTRYDYFCLSDKQLKKDHIYKEYPMCSSEELSYFRKRNRVFSSKRQLQEYIEAELLRGSKILYFKIEAPNYPPDLLTEKIHSIVSQTICTFRNGAFCYETVPNNRQQCFFIRVKD